MKTEFTKTGYSKDFNFFLEHQIFVIKRGGYLKYCSRLEEKEFYWESRDKTDNEIMERCRLIFSQITNKER